MYSTGSLSAMFPNEHCNPQANTRRHGFLSMYYTTAEVRAVVKICGLQK